MSKRIRWTDLRMENRQGIPHAEIQRSASLRPVINIPVMNIPGTTPAPQQDSLLAVCLFAAFCDGDKSDFEREQIGRLAEELGAENLAPISRQILMGKLSLETAVAGLDSRETRLLAYEMARAVCEVGGTVNAEELAFLADLRARLNLGGADTEAVEQVVDSLVFSPLASQEDSSPSPDNSSMILKYSILNGALELLPETLATMAIIPMQMKMVYRIGKSHGVDLDATSIKAFLATAGVGLGSQMVEGFARKIIGGFGKKIGGKMVGRVADQATGSAFSFAATYAIGHIAERYHAGGRKLAAPELKNLFQSFTASGKELYGTHLPEIQERARTLDTASIVSMVRGKAPV